MNFVLGIDQGNSNTRAIVCDLEGRLLGAGRSYGACHCHSGVEKAMGAIKQAAEIAMSQAGLSADGIVHVHSGMTGADWPEQYDLCQGYVRSIGWTDSVSISNDCIIAMRGGTEHSHGAIYVAGTGANCAIRSPRGEEYIYGYFLDGSRQGAGAIGHAALIAVLNTEPGITLPSTLTQRVLDCYALPDLTALCHALYEDRLPDANRLAPLVFEEAYYRQDAVAAEILAGFAGRCAEAVTAGLRRFDMLTMDVEVVVSGSVFKGVGPLLLDAFTAALHRGAPHARVVNARYEPLVGAALLALEKYGVEITPSIKANIEQTAQRLNQLRQEE